MKRNFKTGKWENEKPMMQRVALHAYQLDFRAFDKHYQIAADYPKDFEVLLKHLEKFDAIAS